MKIFDDYSEMCREMLSHEHDAGSVPMDSSAVTMKPGETPTAEAIVAAEAILKIARNAPSGDEPMCRLCPTEPQNAGMKPV